MQNILTFLTYQDRAEDAARLYVSIFPKSCLGKISYYGDDMPMPKGTVMTVEFELNGVPYVALNGGSSFKFTEGVSLAVMCDTQEEVDRYWQRLTADGGKEIACGWLVDKFGLSWQITPVKAIEMVTDADPVKAKRAMQAMMKMKKFDLAVMQKAFDGR